MIIVVKAEIPRIEEYIRLYDSIQVWRSIDGINGTYSQITSDEDAAALALGTVSGPFTSLANKVLNMSFSGGDNYVVTFPNSSSISLQTVLNTINAVLSGSAIENPNSPGKVAIKSPLYGTSATILLSGNAASVLGLPTTKKSGTGARPRLTTPTQFYEFRDYQGDKSYFYKTRLYSSITKACGDFDSPVSYDPDKIVSSDLLSAMSFHWVGPDGKPVVNRRLRFVLLDANVVSVSSVNWAAVPGFEGVDATTDALGVATLNLLRNRTYTVYFENTPFSRTFTVPNESTFDLATVVSLTTDIFDVRQPAPLTIRTTPSCP